MLIDSRVRSSAISALLTIQKVKKMSFYEIPNCDQNTETAVHNTETAFQKISFSLLLKSCQNAGTAFCNETDDMFIYSEETKKLLTIIIPSVCGVALLGSLLALFGYYWQRRAKAKENTAKLTARMTGNLEEEVCNHISHVIRKLDFRVCENKGADQL